MTYLATFLFGMAAGTLLSAFILGLADDADDLDDLCDRDPDL